MIRLAVIAALVTQAVALARPLAGALAYLSTRGTFDRQREAVHAALLELA